MPTNPRLTARLRRAARWLRRHYPTNKRVTIRAVASERAKDYLGITYYDDESALIRIRTGGDEHSRCETLIEEWSHVLRSECPISDDGDHDELFWAIYARIIGHWRGE